MRMLELVDIAAGYHGKYVIRDIALKISPSEIIGVIWPNGCGKSTLCKSIFSSVEIYNWDILRNWKSVLNLPRSEHIALGIAFVMQGKNVFESMSVEENLEIAAQVLPKAKQRDEIKKIYEMLPMLYEKRREIAASLSGGQKQYLAIAMALVAYPKLMVLDELSIGIDPTSAKIIFSLLQSLKEKGISSLIVEQNIDYLLKIADRIIIMNDGRIVEKIRPEEIHEDFLHKIYFG